LPIIACGLCVDYEAVRTAVALRLCTTLCVPHTCPCGPQVDAYGDHSLVCERGSGKITRHQALNDVIARAFVAADIPVTKEPHGHSISDNKRPDGLILSSGASAASRKCAKYANLPNSYIFQPIALQIMELLTRLPLLLFLHLRKISTKSNDLRESTFLFQRLAITLKHFNSVIRREFCV